MGDQDIRAALDRHWAASEAGDDDTEDEIYHDDAVLVYPQSGERIRGRLAIRTTRGLLPNKHFTIRRVIGRGDLWVTEYVISYDGKPSHTVSIMEFRDGKVFRETQYFGDPFEPWSGRAQWVTTKKSGNGEHFSDGARWQKIHGTAKKRAGPPRRRGAGHRRASGLSNSEWLNGSVQEPEHGLASLTRPVTLASSERPVGTEWFCVY